MKNERVYQIGERVTGHYFGQAYKGTVVDGRCHTMNQSYKHYIELDEPIVVFSAIRDSIIVSVWCPNGDSENTIQPLE